MPFNHQNHSAEANAVGVKCSQCVSQYGLTYMLLNKEIILEGNDVLHKNSSGIYVPNENLSRFTNVIKPEVISSLNKVVGIYYTINKRAPGSTG